ncbi:circularly permuted type 2 ATP-grasp protein [uncultured Propionivibrio sp.]|uniref:circularly permuted type 2 ATP-grasp protein n=1 Tax=uncultured Propionivibrio sp. TaxID=426737 RepID=UPI0029C0111F|nr:circularly permuted type 2 ATP-grasp protein [uncultured Propionivibrio sp.]
MPRSLLANYPRQTDRFDEMLAENGQLRPSWKAFFDHLDSATPAQMRHQRDFVRRRILENGVTYNVYADPKGADRPWELDPLPLILSQKEWSGIASAVTQRARLFNALLGDLYGEQRLLRDGNLPAALVYGHNGFLWPCQGMRPPDDIWLHLYAADLARSPDGQWWVIADRTQAPSGAGYALENRLIVSRLFPEKFRELGVRHLAGFFAALQEGLAHWASKDEAGGAPLVVLLTPGPYNETYFEHAYLARYLGYPLVEGQDLTVRDDRVYLKTLTGLRRVHAILRRLDDDFCDPLELRGDSALGVPGLLQAVRAGTVLVANALGSGVLESAALPGFLPGICEKLLGESLAMPSVGTWWCGEPTALEFVIEHLDRLVIKGAYPSQRLEPVFGSELRGAARAEMIERLQARPTAYVAQELVRFSQAPSWSAPHERRLIPRGIALRVYVAATPQGYRVMPGGLTRVTSATQTRFISMQRGGSSKDAWVLSDAPPDSLSLIKPPIGRADLVRSGSNLSSRVVENLFWFGRYAERCEDMARLLRVGLSRLVDASVDEDLAALRSAYETGRVLQLLPAVAGKTPGRREIEAQLLTALCAPEWGDGLAGDIRRLLWVGAQVRERFSLDNWHALNRLQHQLQAYAKAKPSLGEAMSFIDQMLLASSALAGFAMDDMTRDDGWRFLIIGRRLERLVFLANAISAFLRLESARQPGCLEWLLELADSIITYRSRYMAQPELLPAIDLIVFDDANPHAVIFQVANLVRYVERLQRELPHPGGESECETLRVGLERLRQFDLHCSALRDPGACAACGNCPDLAELLDAIAQDAARLSDRLAMRYFTHVGDVGRPTLAA